MVCSDCAMVQGGAKKTREAKKQETRGSRWLLLLARRYPTYCAPACTKVWTESPVVQDIQTLPDFKARMDAPWVDSGGEKYGALRGAAKIGGYCCRQADMCLA